MARTLTQQIIAAHLVEGSMEPGKEIALRIDQTACSEERCLTPGWIPLQIKAELDDVVGIEAGVQGSIAVRVEGQEQSDFAQRVHVPLDLSAVGHDIRVAVLVGRIIQPSLVEEVLVVP